ncbi:hypothetical protein CH373_06335 [Leptospira perolatii]|uniref:HEAT repeat domain-containing protein n=1 Tax=Leptospira perolatii TaxID=2023191 RepID=A0A2M9ZP48_9LEPT|nr:HEAT repeat domain-containing protein [Leptospira perolatii]PJZ70879.1 hypothetical protein CH360_05065 [Leptospira perolatii]PJZ73775.1 hypothetical protein CH373_06335 [Leptospira perolatii]
MDILKQLSSQKGDRTEKSNRSVVDKCLKKHDLLNEISFGLSNDADTKLQADCAEVFAMVSEVNPDLVVPFAKNLLPLLSSKDTKARWETVHALAFISEKIPKIISSILPNLEKLIQTDKSTIVRDHAIDTVSNYSKTGKAASEESFKVLKVALKEWKDKHAKQVFKGFYHIMILQPSYKKEILALVSPYADSSKGVVRKEAEKILKKAENEFA